MTTHCPSNGMRKWLLAGFALWLYTATVAAAPDHGILWRIERAGEPAGHLFGTIHSDRPEVLDLPQPVERVFANAERYAFELDQRHVDPQEVVRLMYYTDGRSLQQDLPPGLWQRTRRAAQQRGLVAEAIAPMEPWALATILSLPPTDPRRVLDLVLQQRALAMGRPVTGLETTAEQLSIFDRMQPADQVEMLSAAVRMIENGEAASFFQQMVAAWLQRDLGRIVELAHSHPAVADPATNDRLMDQLLDQRNRRMVERMQPALDAGGAFVAVGALHLPGDDGLIRLLEHRGYELHPVY